MRLERHGVEFKAAKLEVELSMRQLRVWGSRAQAQGPSPQVRRLCGRAGGLEQVRAKALQ